MYSWCKSRIFLATLSSATPAGHGCKYFPKSLNNSFAKYPSPVYILSPRPLTTICISSNSSKYWTKKRPPLPSAFSDDSWVVTVVHWGYRIVVNWFIEPVLVWGSLFYTMPIKRMATQTRLTIILPQLALQETWSGIFLIEIKRIVGSKSRVGSQPTLRWDKSEIHTNQKYISHFLMTGPGTGRRTDQ